MPLAPFIASNHPPLLCFTSHSPPCSLWSDWFQRSFSFTWHRERLHASFRSELRCSCVRAWMGFLYSVTRESQQCHSRKLLWMRLSDSYFCTIPVCLSECEDMPVKHGFILYCQIFDFFIHVDVSDSVIVFAQPWVQHWPQGCSNGCLFLFFSPWFCIEIYLKVTASWRAKTNLCPSLRDFCERCIQCFVNAVFFFSFIHICHTDKRPLFELFHDCNKRSAFIPAWC